VTGAQPGFTPYGRRSAIVEGVEKLGAYRLLHVEDPHGRPAEPGQFAMLAAADGWGGGEDERPFLGRAFSIARERPGRTTYLLEDVGPGTRRLCTLQPGEEIHVLGPLGQGFRLPSEGEQAILVGGGVGIAPLAILQDSLDAQGLESTVLLGFRDASHLPGAELLREARLASDDGSAGHHGLVTELLEAELAAAQRALVYACGPAGMLEGVRAICERESVAAQLALESGMACGFGACYGCVVETRDGSYLRVCLDGPVIDAARLSHVDAHAGSPSAAQGSAQ
jgi:NAD(P)H-flavin reductase